VGGNILSHSCVISEYNSRWVLIAASRMDGVSDFMYSIKVSLMTLQLSSEWAFEARDTIAWIAADDFMGRVN
jgi:hypothetical protein